jgi:hypothetical protein
MLRSQDETVFATFHELAASGWDLHMETAVISVEGTGSGW